MSATADPPLADIAEALSGYPPALIQEFDRVLEPVARLLAPEDARDWAERGLALARHSLRSWEAAVAYFGASPAMLVHLGYPRLREWAHVGADLAQDSPALAAAFYQATPAALEHLSIAQMRDWSAQGRSLYKGTWKSGSLAAQYFEISPRVLPHLPLRQVSLLVAMVDALAAHSYELASACLAMAPGVLGSVDRPDRVPFLEFGAVVAGTAWADARVFFERGPALVRHIDPAQRARFLSLAARVAARVGRQGHPVFMEAAHALAEVDRSAHHQVIELAETLVASSGVAAMEFIKSAPAVLRRIRPDDLAQWQHQGLAILETSAAGGEAFFRLESAKAEEVLDALSARVELDRVSELIRMYCKALTGRDVGVHSAESLAEKGVGWVSESSPSTEGTAIYLPPLVEDSPTKEQNFAVYKVFATHQAARLEFGSFEFRYSRPGIIFGAGRTRRAAESRPEDALTDMERFFDLFPDRQLAHDLFTIVEDTRIDSIIQHEYPGVRGALQSLQERAAEDRQGAESLPVREAMVENLVRASLDAHARIRWPGALRSLMAAPLRVLGEIRHPGATVEDSAEAALRLYDWLIRVPNVDFLAEEWEEIAPGEVAGEPMDLPAEGGDGQEGQPSYQPALPHGEEQPYESPEPVDFRGDYKPELVQLLMRLRDDAEESEDGHFAPISPERLQEMLEKSVEITISEMAEGDLDQSTGLFLSNLQKEIASQIKKKADEKQARDAQRAPGGAEPEDQSPLPEDQKSYFYDEWDFRANDYKPRWCRVQEQRLDTGELDYYERVLTGHSALVAQTRKQFELLRPEMFRKIKRLPDGEDFDLDAVIEWIVERQAGAPTEQKLFFRRNKVERDVAVAFLLDMSASTDEEIQKDPRDASPDDLFDGDPRKYLTWWAQKRAEQAKNPPRRIIDIEKDALILLIEALETIGDQYGVYGFSGYGRDNVEFYSIKDLKEPFSDTIKRRIDKIAPVRSTRMGPAIRHCITKLRDVQAKVKILVLLSDGRPQDHGYGRDRTEKDYAIHDTKMALTEARREGMVPFALTVDRQGHDYLKQMCTDMGYEVVSDIESLPRRLPTLYRQLTQ